MCVFASRRLRCLALAWFLLPMFAIHGAAQTKPPHVLILYTYYSNTAPFQTIASAFKIALVRDLKKPVSFYEESLDLDRYTDPQTITSYVEFLRTAFHKQGLDLVVPIGAPASKFVAQYREKIFPGTPAVFLGADERFVHREDLRKEGVTVSPRVVTGVWVEDILQMAPETTNIVVVSGNSSFEQFWLDVIDREFQVFGDRVGFSWLSGLSLDQIESRVSALPPHSFILYLFMIRDGAGITYSGYTALERLSRVANAPIYSVFRNEVGRGIVGGRLNQDQLLGASAADSAARILRGEPAASIRDQILPPSAPVYDWRQLKRWGISESRLPIGSTILFREPTVWQRYRWQIVGITLFVLFEALLIVGLFVNLLRRRRIEQSLRQSEQKYRKLHESMMDAFVSVDMSGRLCEFNPAYLSMLGYSEDELLRLTYQELTPEKWHEADARIVREQVLVLGFSDVYEKEYRRKNGSIFPVELRTFLTKDAAGEPFGMWAIVRDITERKQAEAALQLSKDRFKQIAELVSDFVWEIDADGLYTYTSPSVEKILGYTPDDLIGKKHFYDLFVPDVRDRLKEDAFRAISERQHFQAFPNANVAKSGEIVHLETSGLPILDETGRLLGYRGADVDVTEKLRVETETQLLRQELALFSRVATVSELAASIAHEINQPLAAILSNAQAASRLMRRGTPDLKELQEIIGDIVDDDLRASEVIRSLRSMLKRDTGAYQPLLLNDLITDVLSIVQNDAIIRKVPISVDLGSPMPMVKGDRVQLQQVILNLIVNALEAMSSSEKRGTVNIRTREVSGEVQMQVVDSGSGIPADMLGSIFEPFITTKKDGLGLGLALSRSIVTAHGGRLWAENNAEGGATFHMALSAIT